MPFVRCVIASRMADNVSTSTRSKLPPMPGKTITCPAGEIERIDLASLDAGSLAARDAAGTGSSPRARHVQPGCRTPDSGCARLIPRARNMAGDAESTAVDEVAARASSRAGQHGVGRACCRVSAGTVATALDRTFLAAAV